MTIKVESIVNNYWTEAAAGIRQKVFGEEFGIAAPQIISEQAKALELVAITEPDGIPVGTLSVVDTTGDSELHAKYGLSFDRGTRIARLTQLAVLKPYRSLTIPLKLIFEAYRRFVWPRGFEFTWLTFDAANAQSSIYCMILDYEVSSGVFTAEYGPIRVLLRNESAGLRTRAVVA